MRFWPRASKSGDSAAQPTVPRPAGAPHADLVQPPASPARQGQEGHEACWWSAGQQPPRAPPTLRPGHDGARAGPIVTAGIQGRAVARPGDFGHVPLSSPPTSGSGSGASVAPSSSATRRLIEPDRERAIHGMERKAEGLRALVRLVSLCPRPLLVIEADLAIPARGRQTAVWGNARP